MSRSRFAVFALVAGIVSFLNLLGLEKALLAIFMGVFALKEVAAENKGGKNFAVAGIVLGCAYIVTLTVIAILKGPELIQMLSQKAM
ncbi:MAG: hypothetical protein CVV21_01340 [Candidatus Goldiibacteriota bacterium HGW-Goldbacteria-1]|jgi:hypothetical protein|nr:MAG: hypothetical protein CVV21_01340 [Candidatus Goldiibacteriota bacterium HGW-Goldbacteria-1]